VREESVRVGVVLQRDASRPDQRVPQSHFDGERALWSWDFQAPRTSTPTRFQWSCLHLISNIEYRPQMLARECRGGRCKLSLAEVWGRDEGW
jgi:hypothetical protein